MTLFASVILDSTANQIFFYEITEFQSASVTVGCRVEVPLKGSFKQGIVVAISSTCPYEKVKPISRILSETPSIPSDLMQLASWMSKYYNCSLQSIFKMMLPSPIRKGMSRKEQWFVTRKMTKEEIRTLIVSLRSKSTSQVALLEAMLSVTNGILLTQLLEMTGSARSTVDLLVKKGIIALEKIFLDRSPLSHAEYFPAKTKTLNDDQFDALTKIKESLNDQTFKTHLLFGITGSGKTEVYFQAIEETLRLGKSALMLVPEISLTTQTLERFRSRFKEGVALLHHRLSEGERNDAWQNLRSGKLKIAIGARSAVFSPFENLGLIIVDEEHESSYKQNEMTPCYHARDVAVMRGKIAQCTVILGSATPSIESYHNSQKGKYTLSVLRNRATESRLPKVSLVDMKKEFDKAKGWTHFSEALLSAIEQRLKNGEQAILFLNRRGYHTVLKCLSCGESVKCVHCDVPLTFHLKENCLSCHLCSYQVTPPPKECPKCHAPTPLKFKGAGTEQIEKALYAIFPEIRILRMDADTTKHKGSHEKILKQFATGKADLLIGTQMIAKGLHFPEVTLVGILNGDAGLQIPDFRASENTFQIITQVSGRAGRGELPGEVIIQSTLLDNPVIGHASRQDYPAFYEAEIVIREMFGYPPFKQLAKFVFSGEKQTQVEQTANFWRESLIQHLPQNFEFLPVVPCGYAKIKSLYRFQFILKGPSMTPLHAAIQNLQEKIPKNKNVKVTIDVNPTSTFF